MKTVVCAAVLTLMSGAAWAADPVVGTWRTESNDQGQYLHVRISECGAAICGVIAQAMDSSGTPADYEHLGARMIWDMAPQGGGAYSGGKIWAPDSGRTFRSKMALSGSRLKVSGCVGPICRGQTWARVR